MRPRSNHSTSISAEVNTAKDAKSLPAGQAGAKGMSVGHCLITEQEGRMGFFAPFASFAVEIYPYIHLR